MMKNFLSQKRQARKGKHGKCIADTVKNIRFAVSVLSNNSNQTLRAWRLRESIKKLSLRCISHLKFLGN